MAGQAVRPNDLVQVRHGAGQSDGGDRAAGGRYLENVRLDLQDCLFCAAVMVGVFRVAYLKNDAIVG